MSFDLALNRLDHDMVFIHDTTTQRYSIWAIDGSDKVAQQIKITLLAFLGEWFLDITFGVPYLEEILVKNPRLTSVESILRAKIKSVPDVERIPFFSMSFQREQRILTVEYNATTKLGPIKDSIRLETFRRNNV